MSIGSLRGLPVLIVDDNATNRHLLVKLLRKRSIEAVAASGGQEALDTLRQRAAQPGAIRLILLDSQMPDMDGFETARRVRDDLGLAVPTILLRSVGSPGEAARRREVGIHAYLNKPLRQEELLAAICEALGVETANSTASGESAGQARKGCCSLRVLLAEDHPVNRKLAVRLLEREGHRVTVTSDGREALAAFHAHTFDLALMDIQMPEMDGFEVTAAIRRHEAQTGGHLPILAMTAMSPSPSWPASSSKKSLRSWQPASRRRSAPAVIGLLLASGDYLDAYPDPCRVADVACPGMACHEISSRAR